jgi:stearoyl-CoA desaturase (delta-9 desaturase)
MRSSKPSAAHAQARPLNWPNTIFLVTTLLLVLTAVPAYLWRFGLDWFQAAMFLAFFIATGLSITLGYHRLFAHRAFQAAWPVRVLTLLFGAAAFENSALCWASDHRRHHKFTDHDEDPYNINEGFFHAHIGWIFHDDSASRAEAAFAADLSRDPLVRWQHDHYKTIAIAVGFVLPTLIGALWNGWVGALGGLLIPGVARVVFVQHMTFFINSLCHTLGSRPYSSRCTARDSAFMALFTFGEGYHNFHHAFQHDYRNGVKPWQFDPTKWTIWTLHKLGLAKQLRRVPVERILLAEITEQQRQLAAAIERRPRRLAEPLQARLQAAQARLQQTFGQWEKLEAEYADALHKKLEASSEKLAALRREFQSARDRFREAIRDWKEAHQLALAQFGIAPA